MQLPLAADQAYAPNVSLLARWRTHSRSHKQLLMNSAFRLLIWAQQARRRTHAPASAALLKTGRRLFSSVESRACRKSARTRWTSGRFSTPRGPQFRTTNSIRLPSHALNNALEASMGIVASSSAMTNKQGQRTCPM